ncbi:TolC family outer membrane protein [Pseudooceanicola sp. LIPI14-2-Ac024]|uniref:TolC family outer membrane protein n=1 Tax=Pseudooceanicola sp. LIPI14-2-Ac024 TaxID=3344875 RepID=UPI0035CF774C
MKRNTLGLAGTALALGLTLTAPAARAESLAAAMSSAYETSDLLKQNRALLRAADENVAQAVSALRPIIQWSTSVSQQFNDVSSSSSGFTQVTSKSAAASVELSASLLLFDFGASRVDVSIAKESVLSTRYSLIAVEQQILLRAVSAYFEVIRATDTLSLRRNNVRVIEQELNAAQDRFEVGEVTRTDVSLAEAALAAARSALAAAEGALDQANLEYRIAVGHSPSNLQAPRSLPYIPASESAAMQAAAAAHPSVLAAQKDVTVAELNVQAADLALMPSVNLSTSYGITENLNNSGYSKGLTIGIGASGPIYSGGRISSLQRQAMQNRDATRENLYVVVDDVQQNAGTSYSNVLVSRASKVASRQQVSASQVAFDGVREEASLGARTTLDVLDAEQDLLEARTALVSAEIDEYLSAYQLQAAMGRLTAKAMNLPVQIYDPAAYYNMVDDAPAGLSSRGRQLDKVLRSLGKQ